jgi:hypothetical protein
VTFIVTVRPSSEIVYFVYDSQSVVPKRKSGLPEAWILSTAIQSLGVFVIEILCYAILRCSFGNKIFLENMDLTILRAKDWTKLPEENV